MHTRVSFEAIVTDSLRFEPGTVLQPSYPLFTDSKFRSGDRSDPQWLTEQQLVEFILRDESLRGLLLRKLGADRDSCVLTEVRKPVLDTIDRTVPGDIDVIIAGPSRIREAIALQVKQVKITTILDEDDKINKLPGLAAAVEQANETARLGFHQTYVVVLLQVDGRARTEVAPMFRGGTAATYEQTYEFPMRESLDETVGVMFIEVARQSEKALADNFSVGVGIDRIAGRHEQPEDLSYRIYRAITDQQLHSQYCKRCHP